MGNGIEEKDPNGIDQHAPGAKLDADKLRPNLVFSGFANALEQVVKVGTDGAAKYSDDGWKQVPNGKERYLDALGRHLMAFQRGEVHDPMSGSHHLAHVAWNALAALELMLLRVNFRGERILKGDMARRATSLWGSYEWTPEQLEKLDKIHELQNVAMGSPKLSEEALKIVGAKFSECLDCGWFGSQPGGRPCPRAASCREGLLTGRPLNWTPKI